jgi:hypothetical protein
MPCPRCYGYVIKERSFAQGEWILVTRCVMCGWYECPEENLFRSLANRIEYRQRKRAEHKWSRVSRHKYPERY